MCLGKSTVASMAFLIGIAIAANADPLDGQSPYLQLSTVPNIAPPAAGPPLARHPRRVGFAIPTRTAPPRASQGERATNPSAPCWSPPPPVALARRVTEAPPIAQT
jgi:hypothetical protein